MYGSVLKIDSTKKVCKKLQGSAANTASWAINVGNERGEVVVSVLTQSKGSESLQRMAEGLVRRYEKAGQEPPQLLYTDRDCCSQSGPSKYQVSQCCPYKGSQGLQQNALSVCLCRCCSLSGMALQSAMILGTS